MLPRLSRIQSVLLFFVSLAFSETLRAQAGAWTIPIQINTDKYFTVAYPSLAINRQGKIFVVWQHYSTRPYDTKARLFYCSFDGQSWSPEVALTDSAGTDLTPEVAVDTLGLPHAVWGLYSESEIYHLGFDGLKWSIPENISQSSGASFYPNIAIDTHNNIHVVWHDNTNGGYSVLYRHFDGLHWSPSTKVSDTLFNAAFPRIALDSKDNVHVVFHCPMDNFSNYDIFYRRCSSGIWAPLERLTTDSLESLYPDIAMTASDIPFIVWEQVVDITVSPIIKRIYKSAFNGSFWTMPVSLADSSQSLKPRTVVDKSGRLHVVWLCYDQILRSSQILYTSEGVGTWSEPKRISGSAPNPSQARIAADSTGICHVIYVGQDNGIYYTRQTGVDGVAPGRKKSPDVLVLDQNYPNPFNSTSTIRYFLPRTSDVTFRVFDVLGREVRRLLLNNQTPGVHSVFFEAAALASGTYFYQLQTDQHLTTRKMILLR